MIEEEETTIQIQIQRHTAVVVLSCSRLLYDTTTISILIQEY